MQAEHDPAAAPPQHLANADAVPLFLAALRAAGPVERRWGLALWASLLRDSMANLSACDRCCQPFTFVQLNMHPGTRIV